MNNNQTNENNIFAILGFIFSFIFSLLGLIFSIIGLSKSKELGKGKGLSIAGIIISILNMILGLVLATFMLFSVADTVTDSLDNAVDFTVQNTANEIEYWFEEQYDLEQIDSNDTSISAVYKNYTNEHDYNNIEQKLTHSVLNEIGVNDSNSFIINMNKSTIKRNDSNFCVTLVVKIKNREIQKNSIGC